MTTTDPNVLLIGASRGLGLALAEEYLDRGAHVVGTVRPGPPTALHELRDRRPGLTIETLDVTSPGGIHDLRVRLASRRFDLLFHNAGVANRRHETCADIRTEEFTRLMVTNALAPMRVVETLKSLVTADGTIAVMSSGQGSIGNNEGGGFEVYRASKAALNQLMRSYAARNRDDPRTLLLMAPGWVRTDLGGPEAHLSVEESIPHLVTTVDAQHGHGGLQFLDQLGRTVAW